MIEWHITWAVLASALPLFHCTLGITDTRFTINGRPTFLLGMSYYGALAAPNEFIRKDLDDMQRHGFNWIRVWANWRAFEAEAAAIDGEGREIPQAMNKLKWLMSECDRRSMIIDLTLARGDGASSSPGLKTHEAHRRAVTALTSQLHSWRNWYLDLSNERNVGDSRFTSFKELRDLRSLVREQDPARLVTASHGGDIIREEVARYLEEVKVDFLTPHRPRDENSARETENKTHEYFSWVKQLNLTAPIHYQEPFRRGYAKWQPKCGDYVSELSQAKRGGAAGWCFHNGDERAKPNHQPRRSFDLREHRLFDQFDDVERAFLETLKQ